MFTSRAYIELLELQPRRKMHDHGFKTILDGIVSVRRSDLQSAPGRNRTVSQLKAASAAAIDLQNRGVSRFSGNGGYVLNATRPDTEIAEEPCLLSRGPAASTSMTLRQLQQALKSRPSRADLNRLRRRFALANHPDHACETQRETLSVRLSIANGLIDEALKNTRR